jgi:hypothetical protein
LKLDKLVHGDLLLSDLSQLVYSTMRSPLHYLDLCPNFRPKVSQFVIFHGFHPKTPPSNGHLVM